MPPAPASPPPLPGSPTLFPTAVLPVTSGFFTGRHDVDTLRASGAGDAGLRRSQEAERATADLCAVEVGGGTDLRGADLRGASGGFTPLLMVCRTRRASPNPLLPRTWKQRSHWTADHWSEITLSSGPLIRDHMEQRTIDQRQLALIKNLKGTEKSSSIPELCPQA